MSFQATDESESNQKKKSTKRKKMEKPQKTEPKEASKDSKESKDEKEKSKSKDTDLNDISSSSSDSLSTVKSSLSDRLRPRTDKTSASSSSSSSFSSSAITSKSVSGSRQAYQYKRSGYTTSDTDEDGETGRYGGKVFPSLYMCKGGERRFHLEFKKDRTSTNLTGNKQGDHVIAYHCFEQIGRKLPRHVPSECAYNRILRFIERENVIPEEALEEAKKYNQSKVLPQVYSREKIETITSTSSLSTEDKISVGKAMICANTRCYAIASARVFDLYLEYRNSKPFTAFHQAAGCPAFSNEADRVKESMKALSSIYDALKRDEKESGREYVDKRCKTICNNIVKAVLNQFFYPRLDEAKLEKGKDEISFTGKRTNNLDTLAQTIVQSLTTILNAFPGFWRYKDLIIEKFLESIQKSGYSRDELTKGKYFRKNKKSTSKQVEEKYGGWDLKSTDFTYVQKKIEEQMAEVDPKQIEVEEEKDDKAVTEALAWEEKFFPKINIDLDEEEEEENEKDEAISSEGEQEEEEDNESGETAKKAAVTAEKKEIEIKKDEAKKDQKVEKEKEKETEEREGGKDENSENMDEDSEDEKAQQRNTRRRQVRERQQMRHQSVSTSTSSSKPPTHTSNSSASVLPAPGTLGSRKQ